jgi:hypothetical protein
VKDLKLAESTAYKRVKAARLARSNPEILSYLAEGRINLSTLCLLSPFLRQRPDLVQAILGKSKREVEAFVASFGGQREIADRMRPIPPVLERESPAANTLPLLAAGATTPPRSANLRQAPRPAGRPDSRAASEEGRTEFRFAAGKAFVEAVERLRALLWHKHPDGRLEDLLYEAANDFLDRKDPGRRPRLIAAAAPKTASRRISAGIRRRVWQRDGGRCSFVGPSGRCTATCGLEIDHITPWALGGTTEAANLRLLCSAHNQSERRRIFGSLPGETRVDNS